MAGRATLRSTTLARDVLNNDPVQLSHACTYAPAAERKSQRQRKKVVPSLGVVRLQRRRENVRLDAELLSRQRSAVDLLA